jgi:hypothetical protein
MSKPTKTITFRGLSFKKSNEVFEVLSQALKSNKKATVTRGRKGDSSWRTRARFYVTVEVAS